MTCLFTEYFVYYLIASDLNMQVTIKIRNYIENQEEKVKIVLFRVEK